MHGMSQIKEGTREKHKTQIQQRTQQNMKQEIREKEKSLKRDHTGTCLYLASCPILVVQDARCTFGSQQNTDLESKGL